MLFPVVWSVVSFASIWHSAECVCVCGERERERERGANNALRNYTYWTKHHHLFIVNITMMQQLQSQCTQSHVIGYIWPRGQVNLFFCSQMFCKKHWKWCQYADQPTEIDMAQMKALSLKNLLSARHSACDSTNHLIYFGKQTKPLNLPNKKFTF